MTRRHFLGISTGAASTLFSLPRPVCDVPGAHLASERRCLLVDLKSQCVLRESLVGYEKALAGAYVASAGTWPAASAQYRPVIVPGAGLMDPAVAEMMARMLHDGISLLLESGAGFMSPVEFAAHQKLLHRHLNITVEPPVDLWACEIAQGKSSVHNREQAARKNVNSDRPAPYVDYVWPHITKVRDFSRVVPVAAQRGDIFGWVREVPVAMRRRAGKGTLIYLGSPLGPALGAGDPEAKRWLCSVVTALRLA